MTLFALARRSLRYYWRTNLAVLVGVAVAVSVLAGALLVGDSVRTSLRDLALGRLGHAAFAVQVPRFVEAAFVDRLAALPEFAASRQACPMIAVDGFVTHVPSGARSGVAVYGVDERFFAFHGREVEPPGMNEAYLSEAVAREIGAKPGDAILVRVEKPSVIPAESLYGRKEDVARTSRLTVARVLTPAEMGEFSLDAGQGAVRAVFASLERLQRSLDRRRQVNTVLVAGIGDGAPPGTDTRADVSALGALVERAVSPEDVGITVAALPGAGAVALEHASGMVSDALAAAGEAAARDLDLPARPVLSWLANAIRAGDRSIPYSVVTALDLETVAPGSTAPPPATAPPDEPLPPDDQPSFEDPPVVLNDWAARDLRARVGDSVWITYYVWEQAGALRTEMARFRLAAVVPIRGPAADRRLVPDYPGITGAGSLADWDPPFPIDLGQVRPEDDDYWRRYDVTPKAFVPLDTGQRLWGSRHGRLTSLRFVTGERDLDEAVTAIRDRVRARLGPEALGITTYAVRADSLRASEGATDFGEYFTYFSFFLVVSALLLASLFFRLGVEQRAREIGILRATGFPVAAIRGLLLREAAVVSVAGGALGAAGAAGYAALVMYGLRTWWVGAVGTTALGLHVGPLSLALGAVGGGAAAVGAIFLTLRRAVRATPRSLLAGWVSAAPAMARPRLFTPLFVTLVSGVAGLALVAAALAGWLPAVAGFFGAGSLLLVAALAYLTFWLRRRDHHLIDGHGWEAVSRLGFRNASSRPGRSVLAVALIASAAFIIVAVDAFRHRDGRSDLARAGGTGGYPLIAETMVPIVYDLNTITGREALGFELPPELPLSAARFTRVRLRPGDDASCLNLYRPQNPRVLGVGSDFIDGDRFRFGRTLALTPDEEGNPWTLLDRDLPNGVVPVIADANSMTYVLHVGVGDEMTIVASGGQPVTVRFVAALADSIFQSEILMAETRFTRLFPERQGYQVFLIDVEPRWAPALGERLEAGLADFGFDVVSTPDRLASFHQVENTYLSTFQTLGAFGLLLGTLGLATVMFRNVLERRRELALLRAIGYHTTDFSMMILAESALLLSFGLAFGVGAALVAIAPAFIERGGELPGLALALLLGAVFAAGLLSSLVATVAAVRAPLLESLRSE